MESKHLFELLYCDKETIIRELLVRGMSDVAYAVECEEIELHEAVCEIVWNDSALMATHFSQEKEKENENAKTDAEDYFFFNNYSPEKSFMLSLTPPQEKVIKALNGQECLDDFTIVQSSKIRKIEM